MKIATTVFPSVMESALVNTDNAAANLLSGLKVKKGDDEWYIVGKLAKTAGVNATRVTNASPAEDYYQILFNAAAAVIDGEVEGPYTLTTGFPYSVYNAFKTPADDFLKRRHFMSEYDTSTFELSGAPKRFKVDLDNYEIIPEIVGCIIGIKKMIPEKEPVNFLVVSLGFGTVEGGMASESGLVNRTCFSSHGLQYVVDNMQRQLEKRYYLSLKNVHQLDDAIAKGSLFVNRQKIDIMPLRRQLLSQYYKEVVSPLIKKYVTDRDFENCETIYLAGGGALYPELVAAFQEEFGKDIGVTVAPQPDKLASIGYLYNSVRLSGKKYNTSVGLDIGNSSTVVSFFTSDGEQAKPDSQQASFANERVESNTHQATPTNDKVTPSNGYAKQNNGQQARPAEQTRP
jgi:hypothetical protein